MLDLNKNLDRYGTICEGFFTNTHKVKNHYLKKLRRLVKKDLLVPLGNRVIVVDIRYKDMTKYKFDILADYILAEFDILLVDYDDLHKKCRYILDYDTYAHLAQLLDVLDDNEYNVKVEPEYLSEADYQLCKKMNRPESD